MYYRIFYQIGICNEFIRQSKATKISGYNLKDAYIAEARALRLLSWYHAIDMFGNVPFSDENSSVGSLGGERIERAERTEKTERTERSDTARTARPVREAKVREPAVVTDIPKENKETEAPVVRKKAAEKLYLFLSGIEDYEAFGLTDEEFEHANSILIEVDWTDRIINIKERRNAIADLLKIKLK